MKYFFRCLGLGLGELASSFLALMFFYTAVEAFLAFSSEIGWVALGLFVSGLLLSFMSLFFVVVMGAAVAIPKDEAKELKERLDDIDD